MVSLLHRATINKCRIRVYEFIHVSHKKSQLSLSVTYQVLTDFNAVFTIRFLKNKLAPYYGSQCKVDVSVK